MPRARQLSPLPPTPLSADEELWLVTVSQGDQVKRGFGAKAQTGQGVRPSVRMEAQTVAEA
jgi:hypothetical protein